jgi:hypothetical protein
MKSQTYMSTIDKYLSKHAKGEMITQKMLQQNCRLTEKQAANYVGYCIRIGLGKKVHDGLGKTAFSFTPQGDQRIRTISKREDALNQGRKLGKKREASYVKRKLSEMANPAPGLPVIHPGPQPYTPPPVYAADPVMLEKLDTIASGLAHISKQLAELHKVWS